MLPSSSMSASLMNSSTSSVSKGSPKVARKCRISDALTYPFCSLCELRIFQMLIMLSLWGGGGIPVEYTEGSKHCRILVQRFRLFLHSRNKVRHSDFIFSHQLVRFLV